MIFLEFSNKRDDESSETRVYMEAYVMLLCNRCEALNVINHSMREVAGRSNNLQENI